MTRLDRDAVQVHVLEGHGNPFQMSLHLPSDDDHLCRNRALGLIERFLEPRNFRERIRADRGDILNGEIEDVS